MPKETFHYPVYLDYQATTPLDRRVLESMMPYFTADFGNPHSITHIYGERAKNAVEQAREQVASIIKADSKEIYFSSGATESNNLILKGVLEFYSKSGKNHIVITKIEHKCIMATAHYLNSKGFEVTFLDVEPSGLVSLEKLKAAIKPNTALVSVIAVNNEVGVIQPLKEIGELCKSKGVFFHTDAAQALGKIELDVNAMNIDLMSISGHKIYGPKGVGALYVRKKPKIRIMPQMHGGGQERGIRSGTLATPLCVGMGKACELLALEMHQDNQRIKDLSNYFFTKIFKSLNKIYLNGDQVNRVPHNLNISFAGVEGESLMLAISDVAAVSTGSACSSASLEGSYVLKAMGIDEELAHTSIRFGIGKFTTKEDLDKVADKLISSVKHLRDMSPIWEMMEQGIDLKTIEWRDH